HVLHGKAFVSLGGLKAKAYATVLGKHGKILAANAKVRWAEQSRSRPRRAPMQGPTVRISRIACRSACLMAKAMGQAEVLAAGMTETTATTAITAAAMPASAVRSPRRPLQSAVCSCGNAQRS